MGFFTDLFAAAAPWETSQAEAVREGGTGTEPSPAQDKSEGEGEVEDENAPTPEKKDYGTSDNQVGGKEASGNPKPEPEEEEDEEEEDEEEDEEEIVDPKEKFEEEGRNSKQCATYKHHFDHCVERVNGDGEKKMAHEDCVEEFFHLAHCANQYAAPKLWAALK